MTNYQKAEILKKDNKTSMRSCWECNESHLNLQKASGLYNCFECGRWFMNGGFFDNEEHCNAEYVEFPPLEVIVFTQKILDKYIEDNIK